MIKGDSIDANKRTSFRELLRSLSLKQESLTYIAKRLTFLRA